MPPELKQAINAKREYTSMTVSRLDIRRLNAAKNATNHNNDSHRQFIMWLLETHPDINSTQIEESAVQSFVDEIADREKDQRDSDGDTAEVDESESNE